MVPYQQNPRFTGRTALLQTLREKLLTEQPKHFNHRIALYGIGGVGKTQCALEYVYSNRDVYDRIYWISATSQSSLLSGFQKIAKKAQLPGLENGNLQEVAELVLAWLRSEKNWLIVIDNLDDITVVDGFLPENGPEKHTLITTRNPNTLGIPAEPLEVPVLTTEDSIDLLSTLSLVPIVPDSPEWAKAAEIVEKLGYLPLAIEQAAAYVREISGDFNSYYQEWLENHKKLNSWVPSGNRQYSYSVATTWSMSFNVVRTSNPSAARMLRLFSVLNPDGILIPFLLDGVEGAEEELKAVFLNRLEMAKALLELEKFSLVKWDRLGKIVNIHRLIQAVVADEMAYEELKATYLAVVDMCFYAFPMAITSETRPICRRYESQVVYPIKYLLGVTNEHMYSLRYRVALWFHDEGKYKDAEEYYRQLIAMTKRGPMDALALNNLIIYMDNLAGSYLDSGHLEDAARIREDMLDNRKRLTGEDKPATLTAINNLSLAYMYQGRIDESRTLQEELVQKANKILGQDNRETLIFTDNLALSYLHAKRYDDAARLQQDALERSRKAYGDEDELTLAIGHNLAMTYKRDGRLTEAVEILRNILPSKERVFGEDHLETLTTKHVLANSLRELKKPEEALPLAEEVLEKRAKVLGEKHASTINSMGLLVLLYRELGKVSELKAVEKRVLKARE
jgi:tetratricopeptide (TPR) repeat protein